MNKLAIIVPFYKRHDLTKLCFERLSRQSKRYKFDVIVAGSEGAESLELSKGFKYIEVDNKPLGRKLNALLKECKSYDGVIVIGSDNFIDNDIIKQYKEIDTSKEVFYSFNDIQIYSSRLKDIRSDFDYTRAGNGIGVARLYTKPTLKKMGYEIWSNNRLKGLDGDANNRCKANGVEEIQLDLNGRLLLDVKIDTNISAHEIVNTGHNKLSLDFFKRLGKMGEKILALEAKAPEKIYTKQDLKPVKIVKTKRIKAKVYKDFNGHNKGDIIELKKHIYIKLKRGGFVSPLV